MSVNETYQPIDYDGHGNPELAYRHHLLLMLALKDDEVLRAKANDLVSRRNVKHLVADVADEAREFRLDKIAGLGHPQIGTMVVSES